MKSKVLTICTVALLVLALSSGAEAAINFAGQSEENPALSGSISFDASNMYVEATVTNAAIALDEDYLAIGLDTDNDGLWDVDIDAIFVYDFYNNDGASWRAVESLEYAGGVWDCPWSDPKLKPGDSGWLDGLDFSYEVSGNDLIYHATIPFSAMDVTAGDTIGLLIQTRDKNVAMYGGNGRVINYWPASTCFNKLYDPAQYQDITIPEPAQAELIGQLGILDLTANDGINPGTGAKWAEGDIYHLAFVTRWTRDAIPGDIDAYNGFVGNAAEAAGIGISVGVTWSAMCSVYSQPTGVTVEAVDNAEVTGPVFNMNSQIVATDKTDMWDGEITSPINWDERGLELNVEVWTGSFSDGTLRSNRYAFLGNDPAGRGYAFWNVMGECPPWMGPPNDGARHELDCMDYRNQRHLYALSGPLTIVPTNVLELNAQTLYIQTGASLTTHMDVKNLLQKVNACQAMLGYSSTYFVDPTGACVQPGGGVWDLVIYDSWDVDSGISGEIDTAIGLQASGNVGTEADGTVAVVTLTAGTTEGTTTIVFRDDHLTDDTKQTFLSNMSADPVWPSKIDSQTIVIDGTLPVVDDIKLTDEPGGTTDLTSAGTAIQGEYKVSAYVSDDDTGVDSGIDWTVLPTISVEDSGGNELTTVGGVQADQANGRFTLVVKVESTTANGTADILVSGVKDKAGNEASSLADTFDIDKNQITGAVDMSTLSSTAYSFNRDVVFKATDGGAVLKEWTVTVSFTNNTVTEIASGSYELTEVPGTIANLSAKTAWSLRKKESVSLDDGQATNNFTLLGGDINGTNSINILDFSVLKNNWFITDPVADINGDGDVQMYDYSILRSNFFQSGDVE